MGGHRGTKVGEVGRIWRMEIYKEDGNTLQVSAMLVKQWGSRRDGVAHTERSDSQVYWIFCFKSVVLDVKQDIVVGGEWKEGICLLSRVSEQEIQVGEKGIWGSKSVCSEKGRHLGVRSNNEDRKDVHNGKGEIKFALGWEV